MKFETYYLKSGHHVKKLTTFIFKRYLSSYLESSNTLTRNFLKALYVCSMHYMNFRITLPEKRYTNPKLETLVNLFKLPKEGILPKRRLPFQQQQLSICFEMRSEQSDCFA